jgi:branched-chain amino acid transport system substrate-binding protein
MRKVVAVASLAAVATLAAACGGSSSGGSGGSTNQGQGNGSTIKIGVLAPLTGSFASGFTGTEAGVKARFALANASGGINGHKIEYVMLDTQSTPTGDAAAVRKGIQQDHVFGIVAADPDFFGGFTVATQAKLPVVGSGFDGGPEWLDYKGNPTLFDVLGGVDYTKAADTWGKAAKKLGVTKMGAIGYVEAPSAAGAAKGSVLSAKAQGIASGYLTEIHAGSTNVGPQVLAIKNSNTDGLYLPVIPNTAFALIGGLAQAGVHMKAVMLATGYGGELLQSKQAVAAGEGVYFATSAAPVELNTPATQKFVAALKSSGAPDPDHPGFSNYQGWLTADAFLYGLTQAGANPTPASFVSGLRPSTWNGAGLLQPTDFSTPGGVGGGLSAGNCTYLARLHNGQFVLDPGLNPICGSIIPGVSTK